MAKQPPSEKLNLLNEMKQFDQKSYDFMIELDETELKQFSPYIVMRWGASVHGSNELQSYYLLSANEANKNFFDLSKHPELQWKLCCTISPDVGVHRHYWVNGLKRSLDSGSVTKKQLLSLLPTWKERDIDLLIDSNNPEELMEWIQCHGVENQEK